MQMASFSVASEPGFVRFRPPRRGLPARPCPVLSDGRGDRIRAGNAATGEP
jgi:hypothetical protein